MCHFQMETTLLGLPLISLWQLRDFICKSQMYKLGQSKTLVISEISPMLQMFHVRFLNMELVLCYLVDVFA